MAAIADGGKSKGTPARKSSRVAAKEGSKPRDAKPSKPKQPKQKLNKSRVVAEKKKPASRPEPTHPTYFEMVVEAIAALKERSGSSRIAIAKYIEERYKSELPGNFKKLLNNQLRNLSEKGQITQVKGSFKLTDELKKSSAVKAVNKVAEPKPPKKLKVAKISQVKSPKAAPKSPKLAEPATDHEEPTPKPKAARGRPSAGNRKPVLSPAPKPEKMPSVAKKEKPKPSKPKSSSTPANRKSPRAPPASSKKTTAAPPPAKRTRK